MKLLSVPETCAKINASRATLYRLLDRNEFPQPVRFGPRKISFVDSEVDAWIVEKMAARPAS